MTRSPLKAGDGQLPGAGCQGWYDGREEDKGKQSVDRDEARVRDWTRKNENKGEGEGERASQEIQEKTEEETM